MSDELIIAVAVIVEEAGRSISARDVQEILYEQWDWFYSESYIRKALHWAASEGLINQYQPNKKDWLFYGIYTTMEEAFR